MKRSNTEARAVDVSVIIPCLNESHNLTALLRLLACSARSFLGSVEVIVVDGGSRDGTTDRLGDCGRALSFPEFVRLSAVRTSACRARQMNAGAAVARGELLYFVHADTRPPSDCLSSITEAAERGAELGSYATEFEGQSRLLRFNAYLTTFNVLATRGGDQSIFILADTFRALGGYREDMVIMEEYDLLRRACRAGVARVLLSGRTLVSDRKYDGRSWARVQVANIVAVARWRCGAASRDIAATYSTMLGPGLSV